MIALVPLVTLHALRACVIAALVTLALRSFYRRWVGGVTGDLIGAAGEIVETAVLIAVTVDARGPATPSVTLPLDEWCNAQPGTINPTV